MGCDYYIDTFLHVYCNSEQPIYIELDSQKGYIFCSNPDPNPYDYNADLSEINYNEELDKIIEYTKEPEIVYSNNKFTETIFEKEYKHLVEYHIYKFGKQMVDVNEIIKLESRYKR
jgi:hypothetical protein